MGPISNNDFSLYACSHMVLVIQNSYPENVLLMSQHFLPLHRLNGPKVNEKKTYG